VSPATLSPVFKRPRVEKELDGPDLVILERHKIRGARDSNRRMEHEVIDQHGLLLVSEFGAQTGVDDERQKFFGLLLESFRFR
jgi:hypothetical protein